MSNPKYANGFEISYEKAVTDNHFTAAVWTPTLNSPDWRAGAPVDVMVLKSSLNGQRRVEGRKVVTIRRDDGDLAEVWAHEVAVPQ
tara:strand:+ start:391 stop:648 length:258 start_codon:yes stop_codon:yes gene_type:complete